MGGCWLLVFACCLFAQNISAEDMVKGNSTTAVGNNSTSAVGNNSTSAVGNNSTSAVGNNSTSAVGNNSTSAVGNNSTSAVAANSTSAVNPDEELEKTVEPRIASLRKMGKDEIRRFTDLALRHFNTTEVSIFIPLKEANVTVKKAIGSMVYLRMTLEKTNCTKKDVERNNDFGVMRYPYPAKEEPRKYCGPLADDDKEQLDCKFDIFKSERSYDEVVMSNDCKPVKMIDRSVLDF